MEITNITAGPKGIHAKDGELVMLDPNQSADVDVAAADVNKEWFATGKKAAKEAAEEAAD